MISFFVRGNPRAKQSFKVSRGGGYTPAIVKAWQNDVGWKAKEVMAGREPLAGPLAAELWFYLPDKTARDLDNLSKAVLDGMNNIVYQDDKQIIDLVVHKRVTPGTKGVSVKITKAQVGI